MTGPWSRESHWDIILKWFIILKWLLLVSRLNCSFKNGRIVNYPGLPRWPNGEESACQCRRCRRYRFHPLVWKIPWRRKWQPTSYSCLGNPMDRGAWWATGPWGLKELDTNEQLSTVNSQVLQCLGLHTSTVEGTGSIPALGTEILHAAWRGQKKTPFFNKGFLKQQLWSDSEVAQSCLTLWEPMDCSLPGSSVHGIFQAIVLEWIAISFSRGSSQPRDWTQVSRIVERRFTIWATRDVPLKQQRDLYIYIPIYSTGIYVHYPVINHNGKEHEQELYIYVQLNHFAVQQKLT